MKIFQKVKCKAYLKKESDGIVLDCTERKHYTFAGKDDYTEEPAEGSAWDVDKDIHVRAIQSGYEGGRWIAKELKDLSSFEGDSVLKTYRRRVEEEFSGMLVGFTQIAISADIGTDFDTYGPDFREIYHLTKNSHLTKVAVVYFKNNAKRYVLPEDMEVK